MLPGRPAHRLKPIMPGPVRVKGQNRTVFTCSGVAAHPRPGYGPHVARQRHRSTRRRPGIYWLIITRDTVLASADRRYDRVSLRHSPPPYSPSASARPSSTCLATSFECSGESVKSQNDVIFGCSDVAVHPRLALQSTRRASLRASVRLDRRRRPGRRSAQKDRARKIFSSCDSSRCECASGLRPWSDDRSGPPLTSPGRAPECGVSRLDVDRRNDRDRSDRRTAPDRAR